MRVQDPGGDGSPGLSGENTAGTAAGSFHGGGGGQDAVRRMLQLLGPQQELSGGGGVAAGADATGSGAGTGVGTSVEDFPPLLGESYLRASTHSTATRMRSRLFQVPGEPIDALASFGTSVLIFSSCFVLIDP